MSAKITILYDNRCDNPNLQEYNESKILFDTGGDVEAFSSNIEKMQLSYKEVTHLLFSHWHWDHIAGSKEIIKNSIKMRYFAFQKDSLGYFLGKRARI